MALAAGQVAGRKALKISIVSRLKRGKPYISDAYKL